MPLTSSARYVSPASLTACHLNRDTPAGLFVSEHGTQAMLVHHGEASSMAVALDQTIGHEFEAWELEEGSTAWFGLALSAVELEIDPASILQDQAGVGCVELRGSEARLITRGRAPWETVGVPLAGTPSSPSERALAFSRWRLIQRDHLGAPLELFAYDASSRPALGRR